MPFDHQPSKNFFDGNEGIDLVKVVGMKGGDVFFIMKSIVHHESSKGMV